MHRTLSLAAVSAALLGMTALAAGAMPFPSEPMSVTRATVHYAEDGAIRATTTEHSTWRADGSYASETVSTSHAEGQANRVRRFVDHAQRRAAELYYDLEIKRVREVIKVRPLPVNVVEDCAQVVSHIGEPAGPNPLRRKFRPAPGYEKVVTYNERFGCVTVEEEHWRDGRLVSATAILAERPGTDESLLREEPDFEVVDRDGLRRAMESERGIKLPVRQERR